ncbi:phosphotransferase [Nocardia abscessus]|uniref:phosphotransferase n=1 Tax=Nocardia abscessus TaxID=120957 RepID=UPI003CC7DE1E
MLPAGVVVSAGWCTQAMLRAAASRRIYLSWRDTEFAKYERAHAEWSAQVSEHDRREQVRVWASQLWHPVGMAKRVRRVDVFGGTADGWSSLLAEVPTRRSSPARSHGTQNDHRGPCHRDFTPRNLLRDATGTIRVKDFKHARFDLPARDLVGLVNRYWRDQPDLQSAFLAQYGQLTDIDRKVIEHCTPLDELTATVRATGSPCASANSTRPGQCRTWRFRGSTYLRRLPCGQARAPWWIASSHSRKRPKLPNTAAAAWHRSPVARDAIVRSTCGCRLELASSK